MHDFTLADQDCIGLMNFKNFADQDWIGFNFIGSGLDSDSVPSPRGGFRGLSPPNNVLRPQIEI